ncbi:MAG: ABC transporter permease [Turicibacter sp.]|nr:ABC transporter permease [Turicibacter sp.]
MYSKMALKNVYKSFKDYSIYFLTLTFAVCIFYSFNSIESQKVILELNEVQATYMGAIEQMISMTSVFITVILGALIIYANNFLIKKRKKEFGIYLALGMSKRKVSKILVQETFIVGVISLVVGLLVGVIMSQGLSIVTAKLFEVGMSQFQFIISIPAILKTILFFSIIFLLVMLFSTRVISKYQLIDLFTASRKNESIKIPNKVIAFLIFILGVVILAIAYTIILKVGLLILGRMFMISVLLGVIGTFLVLYGLAGVILMFVQGNSNLYLKNLNLFIVRQISSSINTNFISMGLICLMLFLTITGLSTGFSMKKTLENGIIAPFDASIYMYVYEDTDVYNIEEALNRLDFDFSEYKTASYESYRLEEVSLFELLSPYADDSLQDNLRNANVYAMGESQYNNVMRLLGEPTVDLNKNQVVVTSNLALLQDVVKNFVKHEFSITINDVKYQIQNKTLGSGVTYNSMFPNNIFTLIVPDEVVEGRLPLASYLNIEYGEDSAADEKKISTFINDLRLGQYADQGNGFFMLGDTKIQIYEANRGTSSLILYVGLYLGIVFLISSAAVLALQQLSEASDSVERYQSLKKIGVTESMINKAIFAQVFIYFTIPLILAIVHSIFGILAANQEISQFGQSDILQSSFLTMMGLVIIYGSYFITTYVGYKTVIKNKG